MAGLRARGFGQRRVIIKTRIFTLKGWESGAARAHLR